MPLPPGMTQEQADKLVANGYLDPSILQDPIVANSAATPPPPPAPELTDAQKYALAVNHQPAVAVPSPFGNGTAPPQAPTPGALPGGWKLDSDIVKERDQEKEDNANYAKFVEERDATQPATGMFGAPKAAGREVPQGFTVGPHGGLVPTAQEDKAAKAQAALELKAKGEVPFGPPAPPGGVAAPKPAMAGGLGGGGSGGPAQPDMYDEFGQRITAAGDKRQGGLAAEAKAIDDIANIRAAGQEVYAKSSQIAKTTFELNQLQQKMHLQKVQDAMAESDRQFQEKMANVKEMDPDHFWKEKGTAMHVLGGIAMALGALGSGISAIHGAATPNTAMQIINDAIDRDMQSQKANIEKQWKQITIGREISKDNYARDLYVNDQMGLRAKEGFNMAQHMVDTNLAGTANEVAIKNGEILKAQLTQKSADIDEKRAGTMLNVLEKQAAIRAAKAAAAGAGARAFQKRIDDAWDKHVAEADNKGVDPGDKAAFQQRYAGGSVPYQALPGKEGAKDADRTVFVDGHQQLAVNKEVAKDWNDYHRVSGDAQRLFSVMMKAKDGDPASYNAAKSKLQEILPAIYGFARGPSVAQVEHTLGPDTLPDYAHWYSPTLSSRVDLRMKDLGATLKTIDQSMRETTFGDTIKQENSSSGVAGATAR